MLHTLLFVSRWFHTAVEPQSYSSIELKATSSITLCHRVHGLRRRIVLNQHLASRVTKLHMTIVNPPGFNSEEVSHLDDMLRYLDGLKDLKLSLNIPLGATLATFTKVPYQVLMGESNARRGDFEIISHPLNTYTVVHPPIGGINLAPGVLPRLKELAVPPSMAMSILPEKKVTCLNLCLPGSPFPIQPFLAMAEALGHIEFLNYLSYTTASILPGICLMHNLRWLRSLLPLGVRNIHPSFAFHVVVFHRVHTDTAKPLLQRHTGLTPKYNRPGHAFDLHPISRVLRLGVREGLGTSDPQVSTSIMPSRY